MEESDIYFYNAITEFQNSNNKESVNYVFIGTNSNPSPINNTGWMHSIKNNDNVYGTEPFPYAYAKCLVFMSEYPNIKSKILNFAISSTNGVSRLYQGVNDWKSGRKTGIHGSLIEPQKSIGEYDNNMYVEVSTITFEYFTKLLDITKIDVLIVDVEGCEYDILKQCLSLNFYPKIIYYEEFNMNNNDKNDCYNFLSSKYDIIKCKYDNLCKLKK